MPTRISPLVSSMLYALRRAASVETSALGEFEPSLVLKMAESPSASGIAPPRLRSKVACTCGGVIVQPALGRWQLTQRRPFAPRSWKNSLPRSIAPVVLTVAANPEGFGNGRPLGICRSRSNWVWSWASALSGDIDASSSEQPNPTSVNRVFMISPFGLRLWHRLLVLDPVLVAAIRIRLPYLGRRFGARVGHGRRGRRVPRFGARRLRARRHRSGVHHAERHRGGDRPG